MNGIKSVHGRTGADERGFTLVELLVVIGIIAVLMGILIASISKARKSASNVACMSNLRQIGLALRAYGVDNKDSCPPGAIYYPDTGEDANWANFVYNYIAQVGNTRQTVTAASISKMFTCPDGTVSDKENYYSAHPVIFPDYYYDYEQKTKPAKFARLRSENIMVMDGAQFPSNDYSAYYACTNIDEGLLFPGYYYIDTADEQAAQDQWYLDPSDPYQSDPLFGNGYPIEPGPNDDSDDTFAEIRWRHRDHKPKSPQGAANFLFADGRVETLGQKEVIRRMILLSR